MWKYMLVYIIIPCFYCDNYDKPYASVQVYRPRGFKISIPDDDDIFEVIFHIYVNNPSACCRADIEEAVNRKTEGKWEYNNSIVKLKKGDLLYYWIDVKKRTKKYSYEYVVTDADELSSTTTSRTTSTIRSTNKPAFPLPTATLPTFPPQHELTPMQPVNDCTNLIVNITNSLFTMEEQVKTLKKENAILRELADKGKYFLRLIGRIAETGDPIDTVNFVLKEKLDIEDKVKSALKIENHNSIIFEVYTFEQKLNIIKKVKEKLKNSQQLAITYNL